MNATCVYVDGPFANCNGDDEFPEWTISFQDDDGHDHGESWVCTTFEAAVAYGQSLAKTRKLELVIEAVRA